jgi:hypothetical protein
MSKESCGFNSLAKRDSVTTFLGKPFLKKNPIEGDEYIDPKTGARYILQNGKWVKEACCLQLEEAGGDLVSVFDNGVEEDFKLVEPPTTDGNHILSLSGGNATWVPAEENISLPLVVASSLEYGFYNLTTGQMTVGGRQTFALNVLDDPLGLLTPSGIKIPSSGYYNINLNMAYQVNTASQVAYNLYVAIYVNNSHIGQNYENTYVFELTIINNVFLSYNVKLNANDVVIITYTFETFPGFTMISSIQTNLSFGNLFIKRII